MVIVTLQWQEEQLYWLRGFYSVNVYYITHTQTWHKANGIDKHRMMSNIWCRCYTTQGVIRTWVSPGQIHYPRPLLSVIPFLPCWDYCVIIHSLEQITVQNPHANHVAQSKTYRSMQIHEREREREAEDVKQWVIKKNIITGNLWNSRYYIIDIFAVGIITVI